MTGFRTGEFVAEHVRNLRSHPLRSILVAAISVLLGCAVVLITLVNGDQIRQQWEAQVNAGRFIEVVRSESLDGFPSSYCEDLARIDGVEAAGGITGRRTVHLAELPGLDREVVTVTPGMLRVAWPGAALPESGYLAGPGLAVDLGLVPGATLTQSESGVVFPIASTPAEKSRVDGINGVLLDLQPAGTSRMRECLVSYAPGAQEEVQGLLDVATPELYPSLHEPFLQRNDLVQDPEQQLRERPSAWMPAIAAVLLIMLVGVLWWGARQDLAIYRSFGVRPRQIAVAYAAEVWVTAVVPIAIGALAALAAWVVTDGLGSQASIAAWVVTDGLGAQAGIAGVGAQAYRLAGADLCITMTALVPLPLLGAVLARALSPVAVFKGA